jgi:hypothetical protein
LSIGAQVKNRIVPAIIHISISSEILPNKRIPPKAPKRVEIKMF